MDDPPLKVTDGGLIRDGFDGELDALRAEGEAGRAWLAALEAEERERTGIPTLKIGFNNVFGYYLEVTRPYYDAVPETYRAVQTLKDRQRYTRSDLRERERAILRAEEAAKGREYEVFLRLARRTRPLRRGGARTRRGLGRTRRVCRSRGGGDAGGLLPPGING